MVLSEKERRKRKSECNNAYRKKHMERYRELARAQYHRNKEAISARRKELREIKKKLAQANEGVALIDAKEEIQ